MRRPDSDHRAGLGSARTAQVVLRALMVRPQGARRRAESDRAAVTLNTSADMVAPAAAYDSAVRDRWRGGIDARAVRARFSDPALHARLSPPGPESALLFSLLEQVRAETLGARLFPGIRRNLGSLLQQHWSRARPEANLRTQGGWTETFALLARAALGAPLPPEAHAALATQWRRWMTPQEAIQTESLVGVLENQAAFARQSLRVIAAVLGPEAAQAWPASLEGDAAESLQPESGALSPDRYP
ncbi:MAG: hypothetical protein ACREU2_07995, partial [Steroidobacteraceae bacterium]